MIVGARRRAGGQSEMPAIQFVLKNRNCVVRVQAEWTESKDDGPSVRQGPLLRRGQVLVVREHKRRIRGQTRLSDVFTALLGVHEGGTKAIERLLEIRLRAEHTRRALPFDSGGFLQGLAHERGVASDVGLVVPEPEALEADEPRRPGRTEEEETDFGVSTEIVSEMEGGVRRVQEDVHAAGRAGQVIQGKGRVRRCSMADDQEPSHDDRMVHSRLRVRRLIFIPYSGYYLVLPNDSIPASALIASR
jgi:hypothetical protein